MEENKERETKKFTYEQLEQIAGNLSAQVQQLNAKLQEANLFNVFKRLEYCFKVLELSEMSMSRFSDSIIDSCVEAIENIMTVKPEEEGQEEIKE